VVYGPRDSDVFEVLRGIARGVDLRIGPGERWFSAIYVSDLVEGLLAAARCPAAPGHSYFLTHVETVSWSRLVDSAAKLIGRRPRRIAVPLSGAYAIGWVSECWSRVRGVPGIVSRDKIREAQYPRWTCSGARARAELEFVAPTGIEEGLRRAVAWYRENGWL
jgi:nucleoside-diphosphate-sugar epimerase